MIREEGDGCRLQRETGPSCRRRREEAGMNPFSPRSPFRGGAESLEPFSRLSSRSRRGRERVRLDSVLLEQGRSSSRTHLTHGKTFFSDGSFCAPLFRSRSPFFLYSLSGSVRSAEMSVWTTQGFLLPLLLGLCSPWAERAKGQSGQELITLPESRLIRVRRRPSIRQWGRGAAGQGKNFVFYFSDVSPLSYPFCRTVCFSCAPPAAARGSSSFWSESWEGKESSARLVGRLRSML